MTRCVHRAPPRTLQEIDWERWAPVERATLLFVVSGDQVLLIRKKRGLGAGKINGPGGRLEPGETPLDAALRETTEEVCIEARAVEARGELCFQFIDGHSIHGYVFVAREYSGVPSETAEATPLWFRLDEIPFDQMWADDVLWLPGVLSGRTVDARFVFDGDVMLDSDVRWRE